MRTIIRQLRRTALLHDADRLSDGQLLGAFLDRGDEAAFEALVRRLGPMVLGVCRRVLRNEADVEDAFQATFVVLIRKAAAVRPRDKVGNWLYGVAYRTAMKARVMSAKRATKERQAAGAAPADPAADATEQELLRHLDDEVGRLPEKHREALVLCDLEGKSRKEAARLLGVPEGTISSRLTTARQLLTGRMAKYGGGPSAGALAAAIAEGASACVPVPLVSSTVRAACGAVPAPVAALVEGVMRAMLLTKLKVTAWVAVVSLSVGAAAFAQTLGTGDARPAPKVVRPAADELQVLRLEIEALRLDLKATRARVEQLEQTQVRKTETRRVETKDAQPRPEVAGEKNDLSTLGKIYYRYKVTAEKTTANPLDEAEAALKKLRESPDDKQAVQSLDRALQRLREQSQSVEPPPMPKR